MSRRPYNDAYTGEHLNRVAFPLGGIGAGMVCLEGTGALSHVSVRNKPEISAEPMTFSAIRVEGETNVVRLIEGPVPKWKAFGTPDSGNGRGGTSFGLPRFRSCSFLARFPFATIELRDEKIPLEVRITGWSPFTPPEPDDSSLPAAAIEFRFRNPTSSPVQAAYSFHATNFMAARPSGTPKGRFTGAVTKAEGGFVLRQEGSEERPWDEGAFAAFTDEPGVKVNCAWFRGGWFDPLTQLWNELERGEMPDRPPPAGGSEEGNPSPGGSLFVPFTLEAGAERTIRLLLAWYVPETNLRLGPKDKCCSGSGCCDIKDLPRHRPWYAGRFDSVEAVMKHWRGSCDALRERSSRFSECFYDTTLPAEVVEAVAANLTILKSPTVLRQTDGRLWCWEGCCDSAGCCMGSCTHVWNYAQAVPHLFPELERSLRQTEFTESQDERGHQSFRSALPIRPTDHGFHAAADGQLGGLMKTYRDWRISGDIEWLKGLWPKVKRSLEYCIETWDPEHKGILEEPHHNTFDIEFWGPDGMCSSVYLGALRAAGLMAASLGEDAALLKLCGELYTKGREYLETKLFNGEYFFQEVRWKVLKADLPRSGNPEESELVEKEGPKYQYGRGCLSDGIIGAYLAAACSVGEILDPEAVKRHLLSVHRYNLRHDLSEHANTQRPSFGLGDEGGLLVCTWPKGAKPSLPFPYSDEVWTGMEYQVASSLMMIGCVEEALEIVRVARDRYDGRVRNPFDEYECGHWYARAMSSYAMIQGLSGARYDAVEKVLYLNPSPVEPNKGDFRAFLSTATGYGTVVVRDGKPSVEVREGRIEVGRIEYEPRA